MDGLAPGEFLNAEDGEIFTDALRQHFEHGFYLYERLLKAGVAREQARLALPGFSVYYTAIVQMNARSLTNFLELRGSQDAQFEIREFAKAIAAIVSRTHPRLFGRFA